MPRPIDNDYTDRVRHSHHVAPPHPPQPTTPPQAPVGNAATKRADVWQYGLTRREQLNAMYAGIGIGAVTAQQPFIADARAQRAYQQVYGESLQRFTAFFENHIQPLAERLAKAPGESGKVEQYYARAVEQLRRQPEFDSVPKSMMEVATNAGQAYRAELGRYGFSPLDIARPNPHRAADFLQQYANDPNTPMTRLDPDMLQARISGATSPGDYFVRITGEPYMHTPNAVLSPSPRAWMAPAEEAAGFKLNAAELFAANGLSSNTSVASQRMIVMNAMDHPAIPATWESMIGTAQAETIRPGSTFGNFSGRGNQFWSDVQHYDYGTALDQMKAGGVRADAFARTLDAQTSGTGDVFRARYAMDNELGVNRWFRGDGLVTYPDGTPSAREFGVGERPLRLADHAVSGNYPEFAVLNLNATNAGDRVTKPNAIAVENTPRIPGAPNTIGAEVRGGAVMGGGVSLATSSWHAFDDVRAGRRSAGDALMQVGESTATGAGVGAGAAFVENYATRAINASTGGAARTAAGQLGRQALGSGVAGGIVNTAFALHDNYAAYQRGEISGAQYTGRVTAEAAVGAAAGVGGAMAGAYIGGVIGTAIPIPVVGTLAGAAVGMAVGMGVDYAVRKLGIDTAIAHGVTAAIDAGADVAHAIGDTGAQVAHSVSNTLSGAAHSLASVFG